MNNELPAYRENGGAAWFVALLLLSLCGCTTATWLHAQHENREFMATHHTFEPGGYWVPNDVGHTPVFCGAYTNLGMVSQIWVMKTKVGVQETNVLSWSATTGEFMGLKPYTGNKAKDQP